jgi:hypothetical protein
MTNIHIEGDKLGFNSKEALKKFKAAVKNNNFNFTELSKKYIKQGYILEVVEHFDDTYKFNVKEIIVPLELSIAYKNLQKISKIPIPNPKDILLNPENYKSTIVFSLNNEYAKDLDSKHPYKIYFNLLAKTLKLTRGKKIDNNDTEEE